jgi:uncharacterized protein (DUF58 family)
METITKLSTYQNLLQVSSNKRVFSHLSGEHTTPFSGNGLDFKELRNYTTGDDIRHLNWKVTARTNNPVVNIFNEDKQLNVVLVYLNSGGLYFGTTRPKKDIVLEIFGHLMFGANNKKDKITSVFFSNRLLEFYPPTNNKVILDNILKTAHLQNPLGQYIDFKMLCDYLMGTIKQKSLIFLVGDFLELPDLKLLNSKHEIYCVITRDRFEENLHLFGEFNLIDPSFSKEELILLDKSACDNYNKLLKEHDTKLITHLKKHKIKYTKIYTQDNPLAKLKGMLA